MPLLTQHELVEVLSCTRDYVLFTTKLLEASQQDPAWQLIDAIVLLREGNPQPALDFFLTQATPFNPKENKLICDSLRNLRPVIIVPPEENTLRSA